MKITMQHHEIEQSGTTTSRWIIQGTLGHSSPLTISVNEKRQTNSSIMSRNLTLPENLLRNLFLPQLSDG